MAMVLVGGMRMSMLQRPVPMPVRMGLADRIQRAMLVPVMLVVGMSMIVTHRHMKMQMIVPLSDMQPHARRHQDIGDDQLRRQWFVQRQHSDHSAKEGRC